tara:strand:+ start:749 stop:1072 length:324 start_codon:yes stop_codon:yes gene_type:complete
MKTDSKSNHKSTEDLVKDRIYFAHQALMEYKDVLSAMNIKAIKFDFSNGQIYVLDYPPEDSKTDTTAPTTKDNKELSAAMQKLLTTVGADASALRLFVDALDDERKH